VRKVAENKKGVERGLSPTSIRENPFMKWAKGGANEEAQRTVTEQSESQKNKNPSPSPINANAKTTRVQNRNAEVQPFESASQKTGRSTPLPEAIPTTGRNTPRKAPSMKGNIPEVKPHKTVQIVESETIRRSPLLAATYQRWTQLKHLVLSKSRMPSDRQQ
jgi:hypothetical protein